MKTVPLSSIKTNERNPRQITEEQFKKLLASIADLPKMMALRPIIVDGDGIILGGNMRYKALQHMGMKEVPADWIRKADDLTDEEKRRFVIADNVGFGEWDMDILSADYELPELEAFGLSLDGVGAFDATEEPAPELADGDRAPFRQATFTLHDEQWEEVEAALAKAKKDGGGESAVNENSNGNALAWICGRFNRVEC